MHNWKSKRVLLRYLCCFLIVLLVPMLLLCGYFIHSLNTLLARQTMEMKSAAFREELGQTFGLLDNIFVRANQMSVSDNFGRYRLLNPIQYGKEIIGELNASQKICAAADAVYLYSDSLEYVYSDTSTYTSKRFVRHLAEQGLAEQDFDRTIRQADMSNGHAVYTDRSIWLFFHFPTHALTSDLYLLFECNPARLNPKAPSGQPPAQSGYGIYKDGSTRYFYGDSNFDAADAVIKKMLSASPDCDSLLSCTFTDNGQIYDLFTACYPATGFYYYSVSPQDSIVSLVTQNQKLTYLVIFCTFFCGNLLCLFCTYISYRPIRLLNTKAKTILQRLSKNDAISAASSEIDLIQAALHSLQASLDTFTDAGSISSRAIRQFLIRSLLDGQVQDPGTVSAGLQQLGIAVDADFVLAGIFYLTGASSPESATVSPAHLSYLESLAQDGVTIHTVSGRTFGQIDMLIILCREDIRQYENFFARMQSQFSRHFHLTATLALGDIYPQLGMVSVSYLQAAQKVTGRRLQDDGKILYHTDTENDSRFYQQIRAQLPPFRAAVRECSPKEAALLLSGLENALLESDLRINEVQFLLACILEILASAFYRYDFEMDHTFYTRCQLQEIEKVTTPESLRAFLEQLSQNMQHVMNRELEKRELYLHKPQDCLPLVNRIKDYVDQNLQNQQLSITGMSQEFGVSASYLCRIFKEKNDITILEYINYGRIDLAKQYLSQTSLTVEAIVQKIGFVNASSFIRKFSGVVGMTPGKYRALAGSMPPGHSPRKR